MYKTRFCTWYGEENLYLGSLLQPFASHRKESGFFRAKIRVRYGINVLSTRIHATANLPRIPRVNAITSRATVSVIPSMIM
jgi:hypothetical protein